MQTLVVKLFKKLSNQRFKLKKINNYLKNWALVRIVGGLVDSYGGEEHAENFWKTASVLYFILNGGYKGIHYIIFCKSFVNIYVSCTCSCVVYFT